jgi:hypothetical protein
MMNKNTARCVCARFSSRYCASTSLDSELPEKKSDLRREAHGELCERHLMGAMRQLPGLSII